MPLPLAIELPALLRLLVGAAAIFYLWPGYAMQVPQGVPRGDAALGNAGRMLLWLILGGYILAVVHFFNAAGLILVLLLVRFARRPSGGQPGGAGAGPQQLAQGLLRDLDDLGNWPQRALLRLRAKHSARSWYAALTPYRVLAGLGLLAVLGVSIWLRLDLALQHAALPFSDSDVTLFWSKAVNEQLLFPNGVYPYGYYLTLAALMRLSGAAPIVAAKFFTPLLGILMVVSVGYVAYRISGSVVPAIVAVLVYGTLPHLLPYSYLRQVGIDEQELGTALVLPVLWFTYMSWLRPDGWYRGTALALLTVAALTHPIGALDAAAAAIAGTLAAWLTSGVRWQHLSWYLRWTPAAVLVSLLPIAIPLAAGLHLDTAGSAFAFSVNLQAAPPIDPVAQLALAVAVALFLVRLLRLAGDRGTREQLGAALAALLALALALAIQEAPIFGIHSAVLVSRSGEFAALTEALCLGLGLAAAGEFLALIRPALGRWSSLALALGLTAAAWSAVPPAPFNAFASARWLPDDFVAAYARIAATQPPGTWLAVSDDSGFDYAYGQGLFMTAQDFSSHVGTQGSWPVYHFPGRPAAPLAARTVFLFVDRRIVVAPAYRPVVLPRRRRAQRLIRRWLTAWQAGHGPLAVYFRGPDLTVYELTSPSPP